MILQAALIDCFIWLLPVSHVPRSNMAFFLFGEADAAIFGYMVYFWPLEMGLDIFVSWLFFLLIYQKIIVLTLNTIGRRRSLLRRWPFR